MVVYLAGDDLNSYMFTISLGHGAVLSQKNVISDCSGPSWYVFVFIHVYVQFLFDIRLDFRSKFKAAVNNTVAIFHLHVVSILIFNSYFLIP